MRLVRLIDRRQRHMYLTAIPLFCASTRDVLGQFIFSVTYIVKPAVLPSWCRDTAAVGLYLVSAPPQDLFMRVHHTKSQPSFVTISNVRVLPMAAKVLMLAILFASCTRTAAQYLPQGAHIQGDWFANYPACFNDEDCHSMRTQVLQSRHSAILLPTDGL